VKKSEAALLAFAASGCDFPDERLPEVVLAGRSNVGKSSLINRLAEARIARTGSAPGTTQSINFYRIADRWAFVDLPGYGYARVAKTRQLQWKRLVEEYFASRSNIALVIHLVDARLSPTPQDLQLSQWLGKYPFPRLMVATKADKLSGNGRVVQERLISRTFGRPLLMASAVTGAGCKEIWHQIYESTRCPTPRMGRSPATSTLAAER
jgi:GTP-binding protein